MINVEQFYNSLRHALRGVVTVYRHEQNFRIQCLASVAVMLVAWWLRLSTLAFVALWLVIGAVLVLEIVNTVLERIVDAFKPRIHPFVAEIKDVMAAAVFIASLVAVGVGLSVMLKPLLVRLSM
jgi:diacylglycerol kinase